MNHDAEWLDKESDNDPVKAIFAVRYFEYMQSKINEAADTLAKKALDYEDPTKAVRYGDVVEAAREYRRVRGE